MQISKIRPKVYTVVEFAVIFAISPRMVRDLIHKGELPALRIGRSYRIPRKAVDAYLAKVLSPPPYSAPKSRVRLEDKQTGFLFPIGTMQ